MYQTTNSLASASLHTQLMKARVTTCIALGIAILAILAFALCVNNHFNGTLGQVIHSQGMVTSTAALAFFALGFAFRTSLESRHIAKTIDLLRPLKSGLM